MNKKHFIAPALASLFVVLSAFARQDDPSYVKPKVTKEEPTDVLETQAEKDEAAQKEEESQEVILQQDESGTIGGYGGTWVAALILLLTGYLPVSLKSSLTETNRLLTGYLPEKRCRRRLTETNRLLTG